MERIKLTCLKRKKVLNNNDNGKSEHSALNIHKQFRETSNNERERSAASKLHIIGEDRKGYGYVSHLKSDISLLDIMIINNVKNKDNRLSDYQKILLNS